MHADGGGGEVLWILSPCYFDGALKGRRWNYQPNAVGSKCEYTRCGKETKSGVEQITLLNIKAVISTHTTHTHTNTHKYTCIKPFPNTLCIGRQHSAFECTRIIRAVDGPGGIVCRTEPGKPGGVDLRSNCCRNREKVLVRSVCFVFIWGGGGGEINILAFLAARMSIFVRRKKAPRRRDAGKVKFQFIDRQEVHSNVMCHITLSIHCTVYYLFKGDLKHWYLFIYLRMYFPLRSAALRSVGHTVITN